MKLQEIYDHKLDTELNQIIKEMSEEYLMLIEADILEEGLPDLIQKGAKKVANLTKSIKDLGKKGLDKVQVKLMSLMMDKMPQAAKNLKEFIGNHKVATAVVIVLAATMLGMDPASAGQLDTTHLQHMADAAQNSDAIHTAGLDHLTGGNAGHTLTGGDTFAALSPNQQDSIADKMLGFIKNQMSAEHRSYKINGQPISFDQAIKMAEKGTDMKAHDFMKFMADKGLGKTQIQAEFTKWLRQGIKASMGMG